MRFWWHFTWIFFLVWTAVGLFVFPLGPADTWAHRVTDDLGAQEGLIGFMRWADAIWMVAASIVVIWSQWTMEGARKTLISCLIIGVGSAVVEWVGAKTGFPFGPYIYTDNMGWRIGGVLPFTIPLAWIIIITGGRYLVAYLFPQLKSRAFAVAVGVVALLTDFNLEIVAWKIRFYWVWYPLHPGPVPLLPPWQNYAAWLALGICFARLLPAVPSFPRTAPFWRPIWVLILINVMFLTANVVRWIGLANG